MNLSTIISFGDIFEQLSMNIIIESAKLEPETIFENTISDIKANHLKSITSINMNVSAITPNKPSLYYEHIKLNLIPWIIRKSPVKPPQFIKNLSSLHPKGHTQL